MIEFWTTVLVILSWAVGYTMGLCDRSDRR
jgi:uncharacterized membrane protein